MSFWVQEKSARIFKKRKQLLNSEDKIPLSKIPATEILIQLKE